MRKLTLHQIVAAAALFLFFASQAALAEDVGPRHVTAAGCHHVNGTCYITLDGAVFGASLGCSGGTTNTFRFDDGDTAIGRRSYASFMAAFLSNKQVTVNLSGCSSGGSPALQYFNVMN